MNARRVFLHPILLHRRSRLIFFWFVACSVVASATLWWGLESLLAEGGGTDVAGPFAATVFLRPFLRAVVVLACGFFATALTAGGLIGPIHRIEEWLAGRAGTGSGRSLGVRAGDPFETLIRLLNELHQRQKGTAAAKKPRTRTAAVKPRKATRLRAL